MGEGTAAYTAYAYDNLGRRASITRGNGITTTYGYDPASRLTSLAHNLPGSSNDQTLTFTYNPAGQILTRTGSNAAYDAPAPATGSNTYPINGLNQSGAGGLMLPYDLKGNLLGDATQSYTYDQANRLTSHTSGGVTATLTWDPLSRLAEMVGTQGARYLYDGDQIAGIATNASPTLINRIVHGPWPDEVAVVYPTSSTPLWNLQDNLGSTIAITTNTGTPTNILAYDENGLPKSTNTGRFQYTGQLWLPDFGVYHYKARAYNPTLGRFLQTDPIGYAAGANLYGYVGGDPVNWTDPLGFEKVLQCTFTVTGHRNPDGSVTGTGQSEPICDGAPGNPTIGGGPAGGIFGFPGSGSPFGGASSGSNGMGAATLFDGVTPEDKCTLRFWGEVFSATGTATVSLGGGAAMTGMIATATGVGAEVGVPLTAFGVMGMGLGEGISGIGSLMSWAGGDPREAMVNAGASFLPVSGLYRGVAKKMIENAVTNAIAELLPEPPESVCP